MTPGDRSTGDREYDGGDRGLVRVARSGRSGRGERTWSVSVRVGDAREDVIAALDVALEVEARLRAGDSGPA